MGADIKISEEDWIVYHCLKGRVSEINLTLKYISSHKVDEWTDIDLEAVEQE